MRPSPILESVPNFSEGRQPSVVAAIVEAMASVPDAAVLDVSTGAAANRTVVTLAGAPAAVVEATFRGIAEATARIDMREHRGVHPRIGAADVVPLVPVRGLTMAEASARARDLAARVGAELGVPVYRYGASAAADRPGDLASLRRGQYEGLPARLCDGNLLPDDGPRAWSATTARTGASAIGARDFLVALNATLETDDLGLARRIAASVRSHGAVLRSAEGSVLRDALGRPQRSPGPFPGVRAIGWRIAEYDRAQVSMNLVQPMRTPIYAVIGHIEALARSAGVGIAGCELIGLLPEAVLRRVGSDAGAHSDHLQAGFDALRLDHLRPLGLEDVLLEARLRVAGLWEG